MQRYAVFDLDETITTRGTWGRFVSLAVRREPWKLIALWFRAGIAQIFYKWGAQERMSVKRGMLRWSLSGKSRSGLEALAEDFAEKEIKRGLRPGAIREISARKGAGDRIIIASAGADLIVDAIAKRLDVDRVVCTKLAWNDEVCGRTFGSENCYGEGKLQMLQKCLETFDDFQRETAHITVYSDSYSDLPVLKYADKGVAVNSDARLKKAADVSGFETVDWSK